MSDVEICGWAALTDDERASLIGDIDRIFYTSSSTQSFANDAAKSAFRERWLGRYLTNYPRAALIARSSDGRAIGYVIGSFDDPARDPLLDGVVPAAFHPLSDRYDAHLHINVADDWRGRGVGALLIEAFVGLAREAGARGVHVVTGHGMRNVRFYRANGFEERGRTRVNDRDLVFLGRDL